MRDLIRHRLPALLFPRRRPPFRPAEPTQPAGCLPQEHAPSLSLSAGEAESTRQNRPPAPCTERRRPPALGLLSGGPRSCSWSVRNVPRAGRAPAVPMRAGGAERLRPRDRKAPFRCRQASGQVSYYGQGGSRLLGLSAHRSDHRHGGLLGAPARAPRVIFEICCAFVTFACCKGVCCTLGPRAGCRARTKGNAPDAHRPPQGAAVAKSHSLRCGSRPGRRSRRGRRR